MNVLVGMVAKLPAKSLRAWAGSFRRVAGPVPRIILLADPADNYRELEVYNIEIRDHRLWSSPKDPQSICKDRWPVLAEVADELPPDDKLLVTDVRDCVFQRDPFEQIAVDAVTVATEGVYIGDNGWGTSLTTHHMLPSELLGMKMVCAGVWAAPAYMARGFCRSVGGMARIYPGGVDQHCMDYVLWTQFPVNAVPYTAAWTCHCSLMYNQPGKRFEAMPGFRDGKMYCGDKLFAIVHHVWTERWKEFKPLLDQV